MNKIERFKALVLKDATEGGLTAEETAEKEALEAELGTTEQEVIEEKLEVSDEVAKSIVDRAMPAIEKLVASAIEKSVKKNVAQPTPEEKKAEEVTKEVKLVKFLKALKEMDIPALKAMREGSDGDGGYLVPPAEFNAEVLRLEIQYGVAAANANVRTLTKSNSYTVNRKTAGVSFYETTELQKKRTTGMTIDQVQGTLRKFAAIAPVSDELDEDAAINIWNELTTDFAIANAQLEDQIVFTDTTSGILYDQDIAVYHLGTADIEAIDWFKLGLVPYQIVKPARPNAKWFVHSNMVGVFTRMKDGMDRSYYTLGSPLWGYPVVETDILPVPANGLNRVLGVFGDLKQVDLIRKNQMELTMLTEATIGGRDGDDVIDLASQDARALRGVVRINAKVKFPSALVIIETEATS